MTLANLNIKGLALETGMLELVNGKEYATFVTVGDKEMSFEFETPNSHAYVCVSPDKGRDKSYFAHQLDELRNDHPEFFED